ncbi:hypothetical protein DFR29_10836 [Tahibacter aquaticus]|uniref:Uncharacterized protein n=1 Tax=Tahibacter aquaticus TaxID=520092 RepID=A0A4R6YUW5_9GAMM|nr:hypothetical protein DFR29_10836 [Tahibacter aquaticus]
MLEYDEPMRPGARGHGHVHQAAHGRHLIDPMVSERRWFCFAAATRLGLAVARSVVATDSGSRRLQMQSVVAVALRLLVPLQRSQRDRAVFVQVGQARRALHRFVQIVQGLGHATGLV